MRKRNVDKHIWFDRQEAQDLQKKAKKACLTEAALIRLLIRGYEPREKPDERLRQLRHDPFLGRQGKNDAQRNIGNLRQGND